MQGPVEGLDDRPRARASRVRSGGPGKPGMTNNTRMRTMLLRLSAHHMARRVDRDAENQGSTNDARGRPGDVPDPQLSSPFYSEDIPPMTDEEVGDGPWVGFLTLVRDQGGHYRPRSSAPAAYGGFSDVWQCDTRFADGSKVVVAVKKLRAVKLRPGSDKSQTTKTMLGRLKKELRVWMRLQHPNVAPLIGFTFDGEVAIISPWFSHGNILDYLNERPEVDRGKLLQGVADGVLYLHSSNPVIVHGDLKPDNVLIDQCGIPRIIDFGLSKLLEEEPHLSPALSTSLREAGNARWVAPELLLEENASRSLKTDIFSLGCVAFFILTGDVPFKSTPDGQLVIARYKGAYPIPEAASYPDLNAKTLLMGALRSCWNTNPGDRPFIGYVVHRLKNDELGILDQAALSNEVLETVPQSSASRLVEQSTSISSPFRPWSAIKSMWKSFKAFLHNFFKSKPGDS